MRLDELISGLEITNATPGIDHASIRVCDVTEDSRTAVPGSLFIARAGTNDQGMHYIDPAIQCGSVAVLTEIDAVDAHYPLGDEEDLFSMYLQTRYTVPEREGHRLRTRRWWWKVAGWSALIGLFGLLWAVLPRAKTLDERIDEKVRAAVAGL